MYIEELGCVQAAIKVWGIQKMTRIITTTQSSDAKKVKERKRISKVRGLMKHESDVH